MTADKFNARHGQRWEDFKKDPMFSDLLRVADGTESPAIHAHKISLADMTNFTPALMGTIAGFGLFRALLLKLGTTPTLPDEEPDFGTTLEEQFAQEHPQLAAPVVATKKKRR